jgi:hypothetical protein
MTIKTKYNIGDYVVYGECPTTTTIMHIWRIVIQSTGIYYGIINDDSLVKEDSIRYKLVPEG